MRVEGYRGIKIGLEIHVPITSVETKLFCSCPNTSRYKPSKPNQYVCPVCLGLPGALPSPNEKAIYYAVKTAKALNSRITSILQFYRKHYFYPDLPKGYQITQFKAGGYAPLGEGGELRLHGNRLIRIRRIQIEEDPARLLHPGGLGESSKLLIDYNRSGNPLIEIVTEPDINSPKEAREFLDKLKRLLIDIGVLDPNVESTIRADANISVGESARVEIKNIGSARDVEKALEFEYMRLKRYVDEGLKTVQETRHWDERRKVTVSIREKEFEEEYRYFPDPNLPPINIRYIIEEIERERIILEEDIYRELISYGLSSPVSEVLSRDKKLYHVFKNVKDKLKLNKGSRYMDLIANLIVNEGKRLLNEDIMDYNKLIDVLTSLITMVREGLISPEEARKRLVSKISLRRRRVDVPTIEMIIDEVLGEIERFDRDVRDYIIGRVKEKIENRGGYVDTKILVNLVEKRLKLVKEAMVEEEERKTYQEILKPSPYKERLTKKKINIRDAFMIREGEATLVGWIESKMIIGKKIFLILRDWSGKIQVVIKDNPDLFEYVKKLPREAFVSITGILREERRAPLGIELNANEIKLLSEGYKTPLTLIDLARSSVPVRMKYRYLYIRRRYMRSILGFRAKLLYLIREYLSKKGFIEINTPKIITTATEGGAELFPLIFYGKEAFLAQSPQLYKQMAMNAFEKVFEIDSYYRAQKYDTPRHLAEFWSIDVEAALYTLDDLTELAEDMIVYLSRRIRTYARDELSVLEVKLPTLRKPFKRVTYLEALKLIRNWGGDIEFGEDLNAEHLKILGKRFKRPFFIILWPKKVRAFYYKIYEEDPRLTLSFDLMYPLHESYPLELSSGGERINTLSELKRRMREKGLREEAYEWYLEMFKYGMPPHGGFGLGLDRLVMAFLGVNTILDTVLSPRTPKYSKP